MIKKKIFVTGVSSSLMTSLCRIIDFEKFEVVGLTRDKGLIQIRNVTIIEGDIFEIKQFENYIDNCDIIIHAAAITHSFNKNLYFKTNLEATKKLVDIVKKQETKKFIFISSNTANKANGSYSESKFLAEKYIQENLKNWLSIRISEVYGTNSNYGIDGLINNAFQNSILFYPMDIPFKLSPIYIDDAVNVIYKAIFVKNHTNIIFGINGKVKYSFANLAKEIKKRKKGKLFLIPINKNIMFFIMNLTKLIPFFIGVIPDQIERLYGEKSYRESDSNSYMNIESYISKLTRVK
ncbi:MAG: NAD(P)-dependent oxidoreductase [Flavobacteriaceae bacterium]